MNVLLIANRQLERQGPGDAKLGYWAWKALSGAGHSVTIVQLEADAIPGAAGTRSRRSSPVSRCKLASRFHRRRIAS